MCDSLSYPDKPSFSPVNQFSLSSTAPTPIAARLSCKDIVRQYEAEYCLHKICGTSCHDAMSTSGEGVRNTNDGSALDSLETYLELFQLQLLIQNRHVRLPLLRREEVKKLPPFNQDF